jgi:hypothetical protein
MPLGEPLRTSLGFQGTTDRPSPSNVGGGVIIWYTIAKTVGVVAVLLVLGMFVPVTRLRQTCVVCRLTRLDSTYGPIPRSRFYENDCSRWYAAHIEPRHPHVWERGTCVYETDLYGFPRSVGCSPGQFPIHMLSSDTQMRVYQHFKNPLDAKILFTNLTDAKTYNDRLDEEDEDKGHLIVRAMQEWDSAGYPGTWDDWWSRFYARHVEEHTQWLEWLKSDSGLSFPDWQQQRK